MNFYDVFVRSPINRTAAIVAAPAYGLEKDISTDDIKFLIGRLRRKRRLLDRAIGIATDRQRKNMMYKLNKGRRTYRGALNPRGIDEWVRNGAAIQVLNKELQSRRKS